MINLQTRELVLKWTKQGKTQEEIADLAGCHQSAISRLIAKYKKTGSLKNRFRSGRPTPLTKETLAKLKEEFTNKARTANKNFCSINTKKFSELIQKTTGKNYTTRHVERILHKLDFSRITPRSQHIKNDPAKVAAFRDEFKKNFKQNTWVMRL
ncbi:transposase [Candidatus Woesearchaeota archaeon]|nr:transposase [Candidatus Woesearchaeota archaeon]